MQMQWSKSRGCFHLFLPQKSPGLGLGMFLFVFFSSQWLRREEKNKQNENK